jgi:hypothetical protein
MHAKIDRDEDTAAKANAIDGLLRGIPQGLKPFLV